MKTSLYTIALGACIALLAACSDEPQVCGFCESRTTVTVGKLIDTEVVSTDKYCGDDYLSKLNGDSVNVNVEGLVTTQVVYNCQ